MRLSNLLTGAAIAGTLLTACTADEIAIPKSELYAREFIKKFGVIDPSRDLGAATHTFVNVETSRPKDVRILAEVNGKRYLFAKGKQISGKTTLTFDLPKGVNEVIVDFPDRQVRVPAGGTASDKAPTGRAIWEGGDEIVQISRTEGYRQLTEKGVTAFGDYLPENQNNLGKVTQNFTFVANGDFTIYPVFWNTASHNTLGIYYIDEEKNEMVHIPFYTNKIPPIDKTKGNLLYTFSDFDAPDYIEAKENIPLKDAGKPMDAAKAIGFPEIKPIDFNNTGKTSFLAFDDNDWVIFKRRWMVKLHETIRDMYGDYRLWATNDDNQKHLDYVDYFEIDDIISILKNNKNARLYLSDIEYKAIDDTHVGLTSISTFPVNDWTYPGASRYSHPQYGDEIKSWLSRGINIHIKPGTKFGMYLRIWYENDPAIQKPSIDNIGITRVKLNEDGSLPRKSDWMNPIQHDGIKRFYSEAKYNPELGSSDVFAATYMYEAPTGNYRVLGFEDYGYDVHDLNDMMFFISSEDPTKIPNVSDEDPDDYYWLVAAEDLGGTYDWDFNDAVFSVSATHITDGQNGNAKSTEITVEPLAAGGTFPIYVMFNGEISSAKDFPGQVFASGVQHYQIGGELHSWLGGSWRTPINVGSEQTNFGHAISFTVPGEWTIAQYVDDPKWKNVEYSGMGGFYILVNPKNTLPTVPVAQITRFEGNLDDTENIHIVSPPTDFTDKQENIVVSPEMLCLENIWQWPQEECGIHEVYYNFKDWVASKKEDKVIWYKGPDLSPDDPNKPANPGLDESLVNTNKLVKRHKRSL